MLGIKTIVTPDIGWELLLPAFTAAILGGIGSPVGAVLAGCLLGMCRRSRRRSSASPTRSRLAFVVMLIVLLVRPRGLFGRLEGAR